ncbi:MAG: DUF1836 domain-containing protein [Oscillospiraceae bacterium]|nr:DUF1836 domain-containing protein [Oscillospiraceae bacterium]
MANTKEKLLLGTAGTYIERGEKGFAKIDMLLKATGGLSLSQVCAVTGLEGSTIQNWVKRGWVARPKGKKYEEVHVARILIINALKECIQLENIKSLMNYINGMQEDNGNAIIKESELFNYLCDALESMGQTDDLSRGGVESVVDTLIDEYKEAGPSFHVRIRKALSLMVYACVCSDVKRRTEEMMKQILHEIEHPESVENEIVATVPAAEAEEAQPETEIDGTPRKTVSQAIREWETNDISSVEKAIIDYKEDSASKSVSEKEEKHSYRPWYSRKGFRR